nr:dephospho-CoA kinase [Deltaproteobacteria bacterium]
MTSISFHQKILSKKDEFCKRPLNWPDKVIGLTGGIASGKSTAGRMLSGHNFPVIDTDMLAKEVTVPGEPALAELVKTFGKEILDDNKVLGRHRLLNIILDDASARKLVENIVHPYVFKRMDGMLQHLAASGKNIVIVEVPLLFEAGWQKLFDYIVAVLAPDSLCMERLIKRRKISRDMASKWIATQISQEVKAAKADYVIQNHAGLNELQIKVNRLSEVLKHL